MPGAIKCCVKDCFATDMDMTRHGFPNPKKDWPRFQLWLKNIGMEELKSMDPETVYKNKRICFAHFESKHKCPGNPRLHRNAIPTIGLSGFKEMEIVQEISELPVRADKLILSSSLPAGLVSSDTVADGLSISTSMPRHVIYKKAFSRAYCSVPGCRHYSKVSKRVSYLSFPTDEKRRKCFIALINRRGKRKFKLWQPSKYSKICELHYISLQLKFDQGNRSSHIRQQYLRLGREKKNVGKENLVTREDSLISIGQNMHDKKQEVIDLIDKVNDLEDKLEKITSEKEFFKRKFENLQFKLDQIEDKNKKKRDY